MDHGLTFMPGMAVTVLVVLLNGLVFLRFFRSRFGKPRTVRAEVVGKKKVEQYSRLSPNGKSVRYAVIFLIEGRKKSFYVSEFSYGGYRKGEKGKLTYQGDRLIDFH